MCAHLASGVAALGARNLEFAAISERLAFDHRQASVEFRRRGGGRGSGGSGSGGSGGGGGGGSGGSGGGGGGDTSACDDAFALLPSSLGEHEFVVWFGDLNYRIALDAELVRNFIGAGDFETLRMADQLLLARSAGDAFDGYEEALLHFVPTYKFELGGNQYDRTRAPAWCDRILWCEAAAAAAAAAAAPSGAGGSLSAPPLASGCGFPLIACSEYRSHAITLSDHRPGNSHLCCTFSSSRFLPVHNT